MQFETIDYAKQVDQTKDFKQFYGNLSYDQDSLDQVFERPSHPHTKNLAEIMRNDMAKYGLSDQQEENLTKLSNGQKVVIAGQQAGLFMSPSYIIHKIISILVVTKEIKEKYKKSVVPVFWVAGEDHDFDEINHTYVYDSYYRRRVKISYKPNLTVPMSIGFYQYDKEAMKDTLSKIISYIGDSEEIKALQSKVVKEIEQHSTWTELFHALVHSTFKEDGLLIFNSHLKEVRELETPIFIDMFKSHEALDQAFKEGQENYLETSGNQAVIDTETSVHLFTNASTNRELLQESDGLYHLDGRSFTREEILDWINNHPEEFSTNVVTRPLMQESLFNTAVFLGGGAEVKYWAEIHKTFEVLGLHMPIVLKRMEFVHQDRRLTKLLDKYDLKLTTSLNDELSQLRDDLINTHTNENVLNKVDKIKADLLASFDSLYTETDDYFNDDIIDGNIHQHILQLDYLKNRYTVEVKRALRHELHNLEEISEKLLPNGVLQERLYHPWQFSLDNWDYSPLSYTDKLIIIKK